MSLTTAILSLQSNRSSSHMRLARRLFRLPSVAISLLLAAVSIAAILWWLASGRAPVTADATALVKFAGSREFAAMSPDQQRPYVRMLIDCRWQVALAWKAGHLTQTEVDAAMRNAWVVATGEYLDAYAALSTQDQKRAFLDNIIDEQERVRMFKWAAGAGLRADAAQKPNPPGPARGTSARKTAKAASARKPASPWVMPARLKKLIETMPPGQRARISEFYADLLRRRHERGMTGSRATQ